MGCEMKKKKKHYDECEHRLTLIEERAKSNTIRLDELEQRQDNLDELVGTVKVLVAREENVENDVKEIKKDVKNLSSKPGKRYENITETILVVIATAVVTYFLSRVGIK